MMEVAELRPPDADAFEPEFPTRRDTHRRNFNLGAELALTQFKLKYTGSILGYVWSLLKPLMLFGIMWLVFSAFMKVGGSSPRFTMQLLVAIVVWTFFQEATSSALSSIAGGGNLIRKAYFPRWILVVASTVTAAMTFVINLTLILVISVPFGQLDLGLRSLLIPVFIVELYVLVLGISLLLSALFVFYRDVGQIWEILSQVLFWGSAVVYPFSMVSAHSATLAKLVAMNPMAQIIEDVRHALVTPHVPWTADIAGGGLYLVPLVAVIGVTAVGWVVFHKLTPKFAEAL